MARMESGVDEVPTLKRGVIALARAHRAESERIDALPAAVERLVVQQVERFVEEHLDALAEDDEDESSLPDDVAGIYTELDRLAEVINDRDALVAASVERLESLERSVGRLRLDLERAARQLAETQGAAAGAGPAGEVALESLGSGLPGVDAALERARRRRDLAVRRTEDLPSG